MNIEGIKQLALKEDIKGGLQYTIALPDSINKERADLILENNIAHQQIADAIEMLHTQRLSTATPIRIDFMGGSISYDEVSFIKLYTGYDNFHLYGNGTHFSGYNYVPMIDITSSNCSLDGFSAGNYNSYPAINVANARVSNCSAESSGETPFIVDNSIVMNCEGTASNYYPGMHIMSSIAINCKGVGFSGDPNLLAEYSLLIGCKASSTDPILMATGCTLIGCTSYNSDSEFGNFELTDCKPATESVLRELNTFVGLVEL